MFARTSTTQRWGKDVTDVVGVCKDIKDICKVVNGVDDVVVPNLTT
jgi:hypothetical protein